MLLSLGYSNHWKMVKRMLVFSWLIFHLLIIEFQPHNLVEINTL